MKTVMRVSLTLDGCSPAASLHHLPAVTQVSSQHNLAGLHSACASAEEKKNLHRLRQSLPKVCICVCACVCVLPACLCMCFMLACRCQGKSAASSNNAEAGDSVTELKRRLGRTGEDGLVNKEDCDDE